MCGSNGHGWEVLAEIDDAALRTVEGQCFLVGVVCEDNALSRFVGKREGQHLALARLKVHEDFADTVVMRWQRDSLVGFAQGETARLVVQSAAEGFQFGAWRRGEVVLAIRVLEDAHLARQGVGAAILQGRYFGGILPVAHPSDDGAAVVGRIAPTHSGIVVLAIVHPFGGNGSRGVGVGLEGRAVKVANKILRGAATKGTARVEVAYQRPLLLVPRGAANGQFKQVGAFPHTALCAHALAKPTGQRPLLQVGRGEDEHFLLQSVGEQHDPLLVRFVPEHIGVARLGLHGYHGIAGIFREGVATVCAVGKTLHLAGSGRGIECNDGVLAKARTVVMVDGRTSAKDGA